MPIIPAYGKTDPDGHSNSNSRKATNSPSTNTGDTYESIPAGQVEAGNQANSNSRKATNLPEGKGATYDRHATLSNSGGNYYGFGGEYEIDSLLRAGTVDDSTGTGGGSFQRQNISGPVIPDVVVGYYMESPPYPLWWAETVNLDAELSSGRLVIAAYVVPPETISGDAELVSGALVSVLLEYNEWPPETFSTDAELVSGELLTYVFHEYDMLPETFSGDAELLSGVLQTLLITYSNYPLEEISLDSELVGGSLV